MIAPIYQRLLAQFKRFKITQRELARYALAAGGGLLLAAAFPKPGIAGFAWIAPGVMLMAGLGSAPRAAFRIGYVGGLAFYLGALSWLLKIPLHYTPVGGWLVLAAYLALYPAIWLWLCWKLCPAGRWDPPERATKSIEEQPVSELLEWFLAPPWPRRVAWGLQCAALWVALEMITGRLFTGFPWLYLGASQYRLIPLIQLASVTGVYGLSFLVVWFAISLVNALLALVQQPARSLEASRPTTGQMRLRAQREMLPAFFAALAIMGAGWWLATRPGPLQLTVKVALVQPSIPQTWIWDSAESSNRFQQLLELSEQALTNHPDLLVWPEAAVPDIFKFGNAFNESIYEPIVRLVQSRNVWLVLGGDEAEARPRSDGLTETNWFNSCYLMNPNGDIVATYRKRRLVIFGEYIPFGRDFAFIENLTGLGSFTPGDRPAFFTIPSLRVRQSQTDTNAQASSRSLGQLELARSEVPLRAGVSICFEDVFPHLIRTSVDEQTDFLLNLTNNGWFGESAAQWQHAANAVFRAVENGLPLVRCANNGLTCWVDSHGQMNDVFFPITDNIYGIGFKLADVPVLAGHKRTPTFYHQHGDVFGWSCLGLSGLAVLRRFSRRKS